MSAAVLRGQLERKNADIEQWKRNHVAAVEKRANDVQHLEATVVSLKEALREMERRFVVFYDAVDKAEKVDTNAGDSAVSVILWSWSEDRAALASSEGEE
jgi:hypothetical protein